MESEYQYDYMKFPKNHLKKPLSPKRKIICYIIIAYLLFSVMRDLWHIFSKKEENLIWKKLIVIGDSNTQNGYNKEKEAWLGLLSDKLQRQCDIVNRGFSGYNTRYIRLILPKLMSEFEPKEIAGIVLFMGTDDSSKNEIQSIPLNKFVENYQWIIDYLVKFGISKENIIIITPPKVDKGVFPIFFDNIVEEYASKCEEIALKNHISYVDLYHIITNSDLNAKLYLYDGLHLSFLGARILVDNLWPLINDKFLATKQIKTNFPIIDNIKYKENLKDLQQ